ncbi:MAG: hypothetical protein JWN08_342 [Frankiales bacterium]|nr:hypothetical protein [Frankiales bacterium]
METQQRPWWQDARQRNRAALITLAGLLFTSMLFVAFTVLARGDVRVMVVTLENDAGQANREGLKAACGGLPGISVVEDKGNPDPRIQGRFPVRFSIGGTTQRQESALIRCLNDNRARYQVVGYLPENDGN